MNKDEDVRNVLAEALIKWSGSQLLVATHNSGKLQEWRWLLSRCECSVVGASELGLPEPEETGLTYKENAELKARAAIGALKEQDVSRVIADDAGLAIDRLDGAPGVQTARFAKAHGGYPSAAKELIRQLGQQGSKPTSCAFHCAVTFGIRSTQGWELSTVEGASQGVFSPVPRGTRGFGFDPYVTPVGEQDSFGEMAPEHRDGINHRARAVLALARRFSFESR